MTTLFIEPFGGMAGDMFLAALLDLDAPQFRRADLERLARALLPGEFELAFEERRRGTIRALGLDLTTPETVDPPHRHLADLTELVTRCDAGLLSAASRTRSLAILRRIAEAEARVHGTSVDAVHFHEVGAVDTLIDVCGAVFALERLGVERVLASVPYVGSGRVTCAHGEMPVPAPGTLALLEGLPIELGPGGERVTPTGAAILAELVDAFGPTEAVRVHRTGYGAGCRDPELGPPNLVRVSLCESALVARAEVWLLECNLDDTSGEELGYLVQELRAAGALEAWSAPVQMKKDRPGAIVSALCRSELQSELERVCFANSPTLGVRWSRYERTECERASIVVRLGSSEVRVKIRRTPDRSADQLPSILDLSPEHDDLARLARERSESLRELEREAQRLALEALSSGAVEGR